MNVTLSPDLGVGIICPRAGSLWGIFAVRYLAKQSFAMSSSITEEATHQPCGLGPDMIGQLEAMKENLGC